MSTLAGNMSGAKSLAFSPNGTILAAGSDNKLITLWSVPSFQEIGTIKETMNWVSAVAFSPDGTRLASGTMGHVTLWDVNSHQPVSVFSGHTSTITSVVFSPDSGHLASGSHDKRIQAEDLNEHKVYWLSTERSGYITFGPQGRLLASGETPIAPQWQERQIRLWDVTARQLLTTLFGHRYGTGVYTVVFSPDDLLLASSGSDKQVCLWDISSFAAP